MRFQVVVVVFIHPATSIEKSDFNTGSHRSLISGVIPYTNYRIYCSDNSLRNTIFNVESRMGQQLGRRMLRLRTMRQDRR